MKLSDKYTPAKEKITNNEVYDRFKESIDFGLSSLPPFDFNKAKIIDNAYNYIASDSEINFHENIYSQFGNLITKDFHFLKWFGEETTNNFQIGESENGLLQFILSNKNLIFLIADIGRGKTTILSHIFEYLVCKSRIFNKKVIPIFMVLDQIPNLFNGDKDPSTIIGDFNKSYLNEYLNKYLFDLINLTDNDFWEYVSDSIGYSKFKLIRKQFQVRSNLENNNTYSGLRKLMPDIDDLINDFKFKCLCYKYLVDKNGKIPVLIYDNVDPLPEDIQQAVLLNAIELSSTYKFKIIFPIRTINYIKLFERVKNKFPLEFPYDDKKLRSLNLRDFVKKRIDTMLGHADKEKESLKINGEKFHFEFLIPKLALDSMLRILLNDESIELLKNITDQHGRRMVELTDYYLKSGYVREWGLYKNIFKETGNANHFKKYRNTMWVLLYAVLTGNYKTHFSQRKKSPIPQLLEFIINLYCNNNDGEFTINPYFIRIQLLNYIIRAGNCSYSEIINCYHQLFLGQENNLIPCINRALIRLFEGMLIETPERTIFSDVNIHTAKCISPTDTGKYYINIFRNYFEYISFMKDDIDMPFNLGIRSNVEISDRKERWKEVIKVIRYLKNEEDSFLRSIDTTENRRSYIYNFSCPGDNHLFTMCQTIEKLIVFGKQSKYPIIELEKMLVDIKIFENIFIQTIT